MAAIALGVYVAWAGLAFGWRAIVLHRRTGDSGFRGFSGTAGSVEWWAGVLFVVAIVAGLTAPIADLAGLIEPVGLLDIVWISVVGLVVASAGVAGTLAAQFAMGDSWRVGVDPGERTALVVDGPFTLARNPIFSMMVLTAGGLTLMVPNLVALAGFAGLIIGLELQVRLVEEPYLSRVHGPAYAAYSARVGRFVPTIGRERATATPASSTGPTATRS
ncbi:MAG: isoprenylcysteine carboxylmethyltransferase family protein [Acidimicrobiales bacterium]|nr:isoprenylcysteine carboxylmethyltransferase family protein [Acidimicrobiales bacterium]